MGNTAKHGIPYPAGTDAPAGDVQMQALADKVDGLVSPFATGPVASRPTPTGGVRFYFTTDTLDLHVSDGTNWHIVDGSEVGDIKVVAGSSGSSGWAVADGSEVARSAYPLWDAYAAADGYPHGNGDGSSTVNLPDYAGKVLVGAGGTFVVGQSGGAERVAIDPSELPDHTHTDGTLTAAAHAHYNNILTTGNGGHQHNVAVEQTSPFGRTNLTQEGGGSTFQGWNVVVDSASGNGLRNVLAEDVGDHQHWAQGWTDSRGADVYGVSGGVNGGGAGDSHENMPPYGVGTVLVKVA